MKVVIMSIYLGLVYYAVFVPLALFFKLARRNHNIVKAAPVERVYLMKAQEVAPKALSLQVLIEKLLMLLVGKLKVGKATEAAPSEKIYTIF